MTLDTTSVVGRRELQFHSLGDIERDIEQLATAEVRTLGNWSFGQILTHLASVMRIPVEKKAVWTPPWYMRLGAKLMKNRILSNPMGAGFQLPADAAKKLAPAGEIPNDQGLATFREAFRLYKAEPELGPHPVFGKLTREEWDKLNQRHAELHLSFVVPEGKRS